MSVNVVINATALGEAIVGPLTHWFVALIAAVGSIAVTVVGAVVHSVATRNSKCSMNFEMYDDMKKQLSTDLQQLAAVASTAHLRVAAVTAVTPSAAVGTEPNME